MSQRPFVRALFATLVLAVAVGGALVTSAVADDVGDAVAAVRGAIDARLAVPGLSARESGFLGKASAALAKYRGANDLADVRALAGCATAVVTSGTADVAILTGVRAVGETCFAEGRLDVAALAAQQTALFLPRNGAKLGKKLDLVEAKLTKGEGLLDSSLTKAFAELTKAFAGSKLAAALAQKLDAAEDKLTALPPGLRISRFGGDAYLVNDLTGTTPEDRFYFRSIVFSGKATIDGAVFKEFRTAASEDDDTGYSNLTNYGLASPQFYPVSSLYSAALTELQGQAGMARRLQGTVTMRLRRGYHGAFKNYVMPVNVLLP